MAYIYAHIRLDTNQVFYIGMVCGKYISSRNGRRKFERSKSHCMRNSEWHKIVEITGFSVKILYDNLSTNEAEQKEKELIEFYGRVDLGTGQLVNLKGGGLSGFKVGPTVINKFSEVNKGKKVSESMREKTRTRMLGNKLGSYPMSDEVKKKISEATTGKKWSDEVRIRWELSTGGVGHMAKKCIHTQTGEIFNSLTELCSRFGLKRTTQIEAMKHNRKSLVFKYI